MRRKWACERERAAEEMRQAQNARAERIDRAAERPRQAAERARAERERVAKDRLRKMKEPEAEQRAAAVFERARRYQEEKARERLAAQQQADEEAARQKAAGEEAAEKEPLRKESAARLAEIKNAAREFRQLVEEQRRAEAERKSKHAQELELQLAEREKAKRMRATWVKQHAHTKHSAFLKAAGGKGHRQASLLEGHFVGLGWQKNAGSAQCELRDIVTKQHHLVCPVSSAVGCDDCVTKLSLYKHSTSVNDKAATAQWSYTSKGKGRRRSSTTPKATGAPQVRGTHNPFSVLSCNEDVVEEAEATMSEDHSRPEQPQATSTAGNKDPRKEVPKSRPTTTSSEKAKIKRISKGKEIKARATATHATPGMPQPQPQPKPAIQIRDIKT